MQNHTPLPWIVSTQNERLILSAKGDAVATVLAGIPFAEQDANAAFIVTACNAYPELVEALQNVLADASRALETRTVADMDFAVVHIEQSARAALDKLPK